MSLKIRTEAHARKMKVISSGTTFMGNCAVISLTLRKDCFRYRLCILIVFGFSLNVETKMYNPSMCLAPLDNQISLELVLTGKII